MRIDARTLPPKAQEALRRRVVSAVEDGEMNQAEAARTYGVSRNTVSRWMQTYWDGGQEALAAHKRGPKGSSRLKGWQAAAICKVICDRHPEQIKLPFLLWTSEAIRQLIGRKYGIKVSARTVRRYLKGWGFSPQKPVRVAYERDSEAVRRWVEAEYPAIREEAKREKARIYWGDEMGVRSDHQAGRSWSPKGKTPTRPGTGQRFGANVISAITNRGHLSFMVFKKRFTAKVFLQFMKRLIKQSRPKVYLIVDGHPVHRSRAVTRWVAEHSSRIRLIRLPSYSPDLNPDEMLNQDVKTNAVGKKAPHNLREMMSTVRAYLTRRRKDRALVRRYFQEPSVRYAAN